MYLTATACAKVERLCVLIMARAAGVRICFAIRVASNESKQFRLASSIQSALEGVSRVYKSGGTQYLLSDMSIIEKCQTVETRAELFGRMEMVFRQCESRFRKVVFIQRAM